MTIRSAGCFMIIEEATALFIFVFYIKKNQEVLLLKAP